MPAPWIRIDLARQRLELLAGSEPGAERLADYPVSTAARGAGEREGSFQTPRGRHEIHERIGGDAPERAVFAGREPTGQVCTPEVFRADPDRDWILTRILWLRGCEPGHNCGGEVDTRDRFIYIHGTAHEAAIGTPASGGCIRMRNADVMDLFERVRVGTVVEIG